MENRTSLQADILAMNVTWFHEDLELFENSFDLTISLVLTLARFITFILAVIVHRAFYKLMKRLPGRAVNQVIYPYMVSKSIIIKTIFTTRSQDTQPLNVQIVQILSWFTVDFMQILCGF